MSKQYHIREHTSPFDFIKYFDLEDRIVQYPNNKVFPADYNVQDAIYFAAKYNNKNLVNYFESQGGDLDFALQGACAGALLGKSKKFIEYIISEGGNDIMYAIIFLMNVDDDISIIHDRDYEKMKEKDIIDLIKYLIKLSKTKHIDVDVDGLFKMAATMIPITLKIAAIIIEEFYIERLKKSCELLNQLVDERSRDKLVDLLGFSSSLADVNDSFKNAIFENGEWQQERRRD